MLNSYLQKNFHTLQNAEFKNIVSCIVSTNIMLHFACGNLLHIQRGINDALIVPNYFRGLMTIWVNYTTSPATYNFRKFFHVIICTICCGIIIFCKKHIAVDKITMTFDGNMSDCILPLIIVVRVGGYVK